MKTYSKEFYALQPLIRAYLDKPGNEAGGCLHLVLDDENVYNEAILTSLDCAISENDRDGIVILTRLMGLRMYERQEVVET